MWKWPNVADDKAKYSPGGLNYRVLYKLLEFGCCMWISRKRCEPIDLLTYNSWFLVRIFHIIVNRDGTLVETKNLGSQTQHMGVSKLDLAWI